LVDQISILSEKFWNFEEKISKIEENMEVFQKNLKLNEEKDSFSSEAKLEEIENIQSEIEIIKNEFAERGNLYIRLCEELESDRLDNKLMKEELEKEFETLDKNIHEQISWQISDNIDFFIENFKNDIKNIRSENENDRDDNEIFKKKFYDLKNKIKEDNFDFDDRLTKVVKDTNSKYQNLIEKIEVENGEIQLKIKKIDTKLEAPMKYIGDKGGKSGFVSSENKLKNYLEQNLEPKNSPQSSETLMVPNIIGENFESPKNSTRGLIENLKHEQILDDLKQLKESYNINMNEISTMKESIGELYSQTDSFSKISEEVHKLKSSTAQIQNSFDESKCELLKV